MLTFAKKKVHRLEHIVLPIFCERSPYVPKFEDRSQEETERQELFARGDAWKLVNSIFKALKGGRCYVFLPTEVWCLSAPSESKPEERELDVDS